MDYYCRVCMNESNLFSSIFEELSYGDNVLEEVLQDVCQLEVNYGDDLPAYVCKDCAVKLYEFAEFKIRAQEVQCSLIKLKERISNKDLQIPLGMSSTTNQCSINEIFQTRVKIEVEEAREEASIDNLGAHLIPVQTEDIESEDEAVSHSVLDMEEICYAKEAEEEEYPVAEEAIQEEESVPKLGEAVQALEVDSNLLVHVTEGAVRSEEHRGKRIRIFKVANGEKLIEMKTPVLKLHRIGKNDYPQEGKHCVNVGKPIKQSKATKKKCFFCEYCKMGFANKSHLGQHVRMHTDDRRYPCSICNKSFAKKSVFAWHTMSHNVKEPFICSECGKTYKQKRYLLQHMNIHAEGKKFGCEICGKAFVRKCYLDRHAGVHRKYKPFVCKICGKCFSRNDLLKYHLITHNDTMPFSCDICGRGFVIQSILRKHQLCHSDERPFPCNICNKSFKKKYELNRHMRFHSSTKPYKCSLCPKNFPLLQSLKRHLKSHSG